MTHWHLREGRVDRVAGPVQGCVHQHLVGLQPRISEHRVSQLHVAGHQQEQPVELGRDHPTVVGAGQTQATSTGGGWTGNELSQGPDSLARDRWSQPPLSPEGKTQQWQVPPPHPPGHVYPSVACHEHGTGVAGFLPGSWDRLDCQSWDHPACRAGGSWVGSLDRRVGVAVMEVYGRGIQGGQCG